MQQPRQFSLKCVPYGYNRPLVKIPRIFFGKPIAARVYAGAIVGLMGIIALFWDDITIIDSTSKTYYGLLLVLAGAMVASLGNMVSFRNSQSRINVLVCKSCF